MGGRGTTGGRGPGSGTDTSTGTGTGRDTGIGARGHRGHGDRRGPSPWVLLVAGLLLATTALPLLPGAGAGLPVTKAPAWSEDVDGAVRAVAVCKGAGCPGTWAATGTADNPLASGQDNVYSHSAQTSLIWSESQDEALDFAIVDVDVDDDGRFLLALSNRMVGGLPTMPDRGPFWVYDTDDPTIRARGDEDTIDSSDDSMAIARWVPGTTETFIMARAPAADPPRIWAYRGEVARSGWGQGGQEVGGTLVDVQATSAPGALVVAANNTGGDAGLTIFDLQNASRTVLHKGTSSGALDGAATALAVARDARYALVTTGEDRAYLVRLDATPISESVEAQRTVSWDIDAAAISADGSLMAFAGSGGIQAYARTGLSTAPLDRLWTTTSPATMLSMSPDGRYLAASDGGPVRTYLMDPPGDDEAPVVVWRSGSAVQGTVVDLETSHGGHSTIVGTNAGSPANGRTYLFRLDHTLAASVDDAERDLEPGDDNAFVLTVENTGDALSRVRLDVASTRSHWVQLEVGDEAPRAAPVTFELLPEATRTVRVLVEPPPGTAAGTRFDAAIHASSRLAPEISRSAGTNVTVEIGGAVRNAHSVAVGADATLKRLHQGESIAFQLNVTNAGNLDDVVTLSLGPLSPGWNAFFDAHRFDLAAGASDQATLTVSAPSVAPQGYTEDVAVTATSQGDPSEQATLELSAQVDRTLDVAVRGPGQATVRPGQSTSVTMVVENLGNSGETYDVEAQAPSGWGVTVQPDEVTVSPLASAEVTVTVLPPSDATGLATLRVSATAATDPSRTDQAVVDLRVDRGILGLPGPGPAAVVAALAAAGLLWARARGAGPRSGPKPGRRTEGRTGGRTGQRSGQRSARSSDRGSGPRSGRSDGTGRQDPRNRR